MFMDRDQRIKVAIVDDDASLCQGMSRLLRAAGMDPTTYPSAELFLEDHHRPAFACLLLDIQLGGMSGFELQARMAANGESLPVIFITAHDEPATREQAARSHCVAYLRKSDPGSAVINAIHKTIRSPHAFQP
jgi:FixJ family two-component response regulator